MLLRLVLGLCAEADSPASHWEKGYLIFAHVQHEDKHPCEAPLSQAAARFGAPASSRAGTKHRAPSAGTRAVSRPVECDVPHLWVCLCFLSFVSNKNLGDLSSCLRWLLWNSKRPRPGVGLCCAHHLMGHRHVSVQSFLTAQQKYTTQHIFHIRISFWAKASMLGEIRDGKDLSDIRLTLFSSFHPN